MAAPVEGETLSQLPPLVVVGTALKFSAPVPELVKANVDDDFVVLPAVELKVSPVRLRASTGFGTWTTSATFMTIGAFIAEPSLMVMLPV